MRSATPGFFTTFASTKSLMRHRRSQRLKNVAASLYESRSCGTVKAVDATPKLVYADLLEERGRPDLAFAYRWMATRGRHPALRLRPRARKPWAWWHERSLAGEGGSARRVYRWIFGLAAVYNAAFGLWAGLWPGSFFSLFQLE